VSLFELYWKFTSLNGQIAEMTDGWRDIICIECKEIGKITSMQLNRRFGHDRLIIINITRRVLFVTSDSPSFTIGDTARDIGHFLSGKLVSVVIYIWRLKASLRWLNLLHFEYITVTRLRDKQS